MTDPPYIYRDYRSTQLRGPKKPLVILPHTLSELTGPVFGEDTVSDGDADLTLGHAGEPLGERIVVSGQLLDSDGRPIRGALVDVHPAPLDPNFTGCGRTLTDDDGHYRFTTIKPGAYPWQNHPNAWRPAHIHFSVFGRAFTQRLVTQMYFPGDPLFGADPIFNSIRDPKARERMVSTFDWETTTPEWALGYRFDIVLGGRAATPLET